MEGLFLRPLHQWAEGRLRGYVSGGEGRRGTANGALWHPQKVEPQRATPRGGRWAGKCALWAVPADVELFISRLASWSPVALGTERTMKDFRGHLTRYKRGAGNDLQRRPRGEQGPEHLHHHPSPSASGTPQVSGRGSHARPRPQTPRRGAFEKRCIRGFWDPVTYVCKHVS